MSGTTAWVGDVSGPSERVRDWTEDKSEELEDLVLLAGTKITSDSKLWRLDCKEETSSLPENGLKI